MMDLEGLELHQDGESYPNDYFESLHYDFISRCNVMSGRNNRRCERCISKNTGATLSEARMTA